MWWKASKICVCLVIFVLTILKLFCTQRNRGSTYRSRNMYQKVQDRLNKQVLSVIKGNINDSDSVTKRGRNKLSQTSKSIIYNRVNKCGSSSLRQLVDELGFRNDYILVQSGLPRVRTLLEGQKQSLSNILCDPTLPRMVLSRHLDFVDWQRYGCDIRYFNQVICIS